MKRYVKKFIIQSLNANKTNNPANPLTGNKVDDGYFDELHYNGNSWQISNVGRTATSYSSDTIVVVLESPHISEFNINGQGLYPLVKDVRLKRNFATLIDDATKKGILVLNQSKKYSIYLMNAIQYQCSLGLPTRYYRDYIFMYYWNHHLNDFKCRLKDFVLQHNVEVIINLCTIGEHCGVTRIYNDSTKQYENMNKSFCVTFLKKCNFYIPPKLKGHTIKHYVQYEIDAITPTIPHFEGCHPSSRKFSNIPFKPI